MAESSESLLAIFLSEQDQPCPQCEYNLRGLHGTRCPECGEELVLRVNMAEPRQRLLIAGLIGLSAGAGFSGLLLIYIAIQLIIRPSFGADDLGRISLINGVGFLVQGGAIWVWLKLWRKIRQQPLGSRVRLMIGCWFLSLINIVIFSFTIR